LSVQFVTAFPPLVKKPFLASLGRAQTSFMRMPIDLRLARHGAILLLLGMLTGFVIVKFHNRSAGNAAHLTGLIGGYGLIALGLLWPKLNLGHFWSGAGAWITAVSLYLNWLGLVVQGGFGSGPKTANSPLASSTLLWDRVGGLVLMIAVLLSLLSVLIILIGLCKLEATADPQEPVSATITTR
jgi:(hydroxyamino)benzene mutase